MIRLRRSLFALVCMLTATLTTLPLLAEKPLTNADVITLSKLGLGDEAVAAKIRQAQEVDFQLETKDLAKLKAAGVSGKAIAAMLDRSSGGGGAIVTPGGVVVGSPSSAVKLISSNRLIPLKSLIGEESATFAYVTTLNWLNFPQPRAEVRTKDKNPAFLVSTDKDPRSRYYIVRLDMNDKDGDRSLKMGGGGMFARKAGTAPDSDWYFPFDAVEEKRGSWKLTLKAPLSTPGEYGVFMVAERQLFDFGIDGDGTATAPADEPSALSRLRKRLHASTTTSNSESTAPDPTPPH